MQSVSYGGFMDKREISQMFEEIALMLDLKGENPFKSKAYINAARILELLEGDIKDYVLENKLTEIKGIGKAIGEKLIEIVNTGSLKYYNDLRASIPEGLFEMLKIPGLGPKKVKTIYEKLDIKSIGELEYACIENRLLDLEGFGKKTQDNIFKGIEQMKKFQGQFLYGEVFYIAEEVKMLLQKSGLIDRCEITGSIRRRKEIVKDIDMIATSDHAVKLMEYFTSLPYVEEIIAKGDTKSTVRLKTGINMDLRVVVDKEYPYVLNHFTGSKEHNTAIRHRAKAMGIKVNEYGLFKEEKLIECHSEADIYSALGLDYIPPEIRENNGEIEASEKHQIPKLLERQDIKGTFHVHTVYSDGTNTIEEMVQAARKMGFSYIGISDHSRSAFYARGLNKEEIMRQLEEIDDLNEKYKDFRILKGIESDILPDGSLDYEEDVLKLFDFVIASVHSNFKLEKDKMTERLINAIKNKHTTMLGHPTGRILLARKEYDLDLYAVIDAAAEYNKIIEINADPHRLDLDWRYLKYAKEKSVKLSINTDAHNVQGLNNIDFGIGIARKGWLESHNVINTMPLQELLQYFNI
jgi:DNA polymerase (family X)